MANLAYYRVNRPISNIHSRSQQARPDAQREVRRSDSAARRVVPVATPAGKGADRHVFPSLSSVNNMTLNTDDTLLTPDNHAVMLIDHQYLQLLTVRSHSVETVVNNATFLAEGARIFNVPTLFTTAFAERQAMFAELQAVHPEQKPIDRFGLNAWDDERVREWVNNTDKKKLVMAGLWTEVCLTMPVLSALAAGFEVYIVTDASGASSVEAHERAVQRMVQAGARPLSTVSYVSEVQRDWSRADTAEQVVKLFEKHGGGFGHGLRWEWQLLGLQEGTR
jgi:nicotinamidase-related amidase